ATKRAPYMQRVRQSSLALSVPLSQEGRMSRLSTILIALAMGATLAVGCSSPTEPGISANRPVGPGDGTVARMALPRGPLGIAVADEGFAYVTQADHGFSGGTLARVELNARTI